VFSALLGVIVFSDALPVQTLQSICFIIASGMTATIVRNRNLPGSSPEE
jgi:threonine/homoserine efflux transporter RhtA